MVKYFSVEEANALLPQLRQELAALQEAVRRFQYKYLALRDARKQVENGSPGQADPFFELECELEFMRMEQGALMRGFALKGVLLKKLAPGLVDFPALLNGREVLLCWKEGEEQVAHYHGLHDGFTGRRPLPGTDNVSPG